MGRRRRDHQLGIEIRTVGQAQLPAAFDRLQAGDGAVGLHRAVQAAGRGVGQFLDAADKRGQHASRAGGAGHLLASFGLGFLLLGQLDHRFEQATVLLLQLVDARETALKAHGFGVAGKDSGDHRPDQLVEGLGAEPAPGKFSQGLVGAVGAPRFEEFLGQADFSRPADQLRLQEHRPVFRQAVEDPAAVDEALAGVVIGPFQPIADVEPVTQFQGHRLAVEEPVRPPLAEIPLVPDAPDFAAGPVFPFKDRDFDLQPGFAGQTLDGMGGTQAGDAGTDDCNLTHDFLRRSGPQLVSLSRYNGSWIYGCARLALLRFNAPPNRNNPYSAGRAAPRHF